MLPTTSKGSSKITKTILQPKVSSPKSVTTYVKELKEAENLEKQHKNLSMSGSALKEDPTKLNNILDALKSTSKGTRPYIQNSERLDVVEEICDFKNVGDLSNIEFTGENSFQEVSSEEDSVEKESESEVDLEPVNRYFKLDVERVPEECQDLGVLGLEVLLEQLQLQQERINEAQTRRLRVRDGYLQGLLQIRGAAFHNHYKALSEAKQLRLAEQMRLQQMQLQAELDVKLAEKTYLDSTHQRNLELEEELAKEALELVEEQKTQSADAEDQPDAGKRPREEEVKEEDDSVGLYVQFQSSLTVFKEKLLSVQAKAELQPPQCELHQILFQELPSLVAECERAATAVGANVAEESKRLAHAHIVLLDVDSLLHQGHIIATKEPEQRLPLRPQSSQPIELPQPTPPVVAPQLSPEEEPSSPSVEPSTTAALPTHTEEAERMVAELKAKWEAVSREAEEARDNAHLRPLLSRVVGVVNTVNSERHDASNRGKLQQLLNLLGGRTCTVGEESVSTKGNAAAQAFVREQLASRLVTLAHDKQVASMGVYASLVVRLWQLHPPLGELIHYRLLEACPFLAPRGVRRLPDQTDVQFHQSLGFRQREGGPLEPVDKYLTRMAQLAQLYGRIVAMEVDGEHPHGPHNGWAWLARTISLPPYPSVTAALLRGFLSTAGAPFLAQYGRQFRKMLFYLSAHYLPQIEEDALEGGRADIAALRTLLRDYGQTGILPALPEGYKLIL